jgi:hypothetical protein
MSNLSVVIHGPWKATTLIRPDFWWIEIAKDYFIIPLKRGHPFGKATFSLPREFYARMTTVIKISDMSSRLHLFSHLFSSWIFVVCLMVFNATFNNISVISWRSVLLVEETGENHQPVASHWQTLSHNVVHLGSRFELTTSVVIGTDCIGSCKSNYHTITAMTAPHHVYS